MARLFTKGQLPPTPSTSIPPMVAESIAQKPKRRMGKVLGIVELLFVFLAILFYKTHPKPADQLQKVIQRFAVLSAGSADVDSLEFDVNPSPSGSLVSPYIGTVDNVVPLQVGVWGDSRALYKPCRVHVRASLAYQDAEWVLKELTPDVDRANAEYGVLGFLNIRPDPQLSGRFRFIVSPESEALLEQHHQRWLTATGRLDHSGEPAGSKPTPNASIRIASRILHVGDETSVVALFADPRSDLNV